MFDKIFSDDKIIKLSNVNSTNEFANEILKENAPTEGCVIWGISQTNGKGQKGNTWDTEEGKNLTFTIILYPNMIEPSQQFLLNKAISLGIIDFLKSHLDEELLHIKWPNDIYAGKSKIAGILIENQILGNSIQSSIIGIGLNINQLKFSSNIPNPISIKLVTGIDLNIEIALYQLLHEIEKRITNLYNSDIESLNNDYLNSLLNYQKYKKYFWNNIEIEAMIIAISEFGQLILKTKEDKIIKCNFKEIVFLPD